MTVERSLIASAAGHISWANTSDRSARTQAGREAAFRRFEQMVDPNNELPEQERQLRAENMRHAHMKLLAQKSRKARAAKRRK